MTTLWREDTPNAGSLCFLTGDAAATPKTKMSTPRCGTPIEDRLSLALLAAGILSFHEMKGTAPSRTPLAHITCDPVLFLGIG